MQVEIYYNDKNCENTKIVKNGIEKIENKKMGDEDIIAFYFFTGGYYPIRKNCVRKVVVICE